MPARLIHAMRRGQPVLTMAGARIDPVPPSVAAAFLARLPTHEQSWTNDIETAVGAITDCGELLAVAVLSRPAEGRAAAFVAVAPARRRLGLGADLLLVLLGEAASRGLLVLTLPPGPSARPSQLLCRTLGLVPVVHWRHGEATVEIPVPGAR